jgi:signal transduction histidine kinase
VKWDRKENSRIGKTHGRDRAGAIHYTIDQLIFEYHILRQAICEVMEEETPLDPTDREIILCSVEQAVNDAATEFSDTLGDIQQKLASTLTHDLRGPITVALSCAELILQKPDDADQAVKSSARIVQSMDRLASMTEDLLDASRLRAGQRLPLDPEEFDLDHLLKQLMDEQSLIYGKRFVFNSSGPATGYWSKGGLRRVIENLVTNAVKFSPEGTPIGVELRQSPTQVRLSIHNQGEAIPKEDQSLIFQQFRRSRTAEGQVGWGLGLTVVKGMVEAHGGTVRVESANEVGTTFSVELPKDFRQRSGQELEEIVPEEC